ncbi:hypothetical protein [Desulfoluna spongiiphila]|uniref:hypothetical protein n=1 Tax=Desulfoluna spongiiphila TaxID=419481 RepID=UPI00125F28F8|nr:hypothetical protein [Desulfoluna spongiiphila]
MIKKLKDIISNLANETVYISFATNSVSIIPDIENSEVPWSIWIDPPWRFLVKKKPIMSSIDCPWHEDFSTESEYKVSFQNWCKRIGQPSKIIEKSFVCDAPNDLVIEFDDGSMIQVFVSEESEESWYYCDRFHNKYLTVYGCGVKEEAGQSEQGT